MQWNTRCNTLLDRLIDWLGDWFVLCFLHLLSSMQYFLSVLSGFIPSGRRCEQSEDVQSLLWRASGQRSAGRRVGLDDLPHGSSRRGEHSKVLFAWTAWTVDHRGVVRGMDGCRAVGSTGAHVTRGGGDWCSSVVNQERMQSPELEHLFSAWLFVVCCLSFFPTSLSHTPDYNGKAVTRVSVLCRVADPVARCQALTAVVNKLPVENYDNLG